MSFDLSPKYRGRIAQRWADTAADHPGELLFQATIVALVALVFVMGVLL